MRTIIFLVFLVGLSQPAWAWSDVAPQVEEKVEKKKPPINPDNPGGPPAASTWSGAAPQAERRVEKKKPPINPDNPGGPPAAAETDTLPAGASSLPLLGVIGILLLLVALMVRTWRQRLETTTKHSAPNDKF